ncbi:MAG: CHASE sensor domain-containing protein, partial [Candidatus Acidiferrum sp.]
MIARQHKSIARKLTWMNLFVSGTALLLACASFIAYDMLTFRSTLVRNLSTQAQIISANSVSALLFNDPQSAENTLSALRAAHNILSAGIYSKNGALFASYSRNPAGKIPSISPLAPGELESHWFESKEIVLVRPIVFQGKFSGTVYIRSDLQELNTRLEEYLGIAVIVLAVCLIAALLVSSVFRRALAQPIIQLAELAKVVSREKNYSVRASLGRANDELALL